MKIQSIAIVYLLCMSVSIGHWFAFEYDRNGDTTTAGNPVTGVVVSMFWPAYVSYVIFKE